MTNGFDQLFVLKQRGAYGHAAHLSKGPLCVWVL